MMDKRSDEKLNIIIIVLSISFFYILALMHSIYLLLLLLPALILAESASDYTTAICRIVGSEIQATIFNHYIPLLHVDLFQNDSVLLYATTQNKAQKYMSDFASARSTISCADKWIDSFILRNNYTCYFYGSKVVINDPGSNFRVLVITFYIVSCLVCWLLLISCIDVILWVTLGWTGLPFVACMCWLIGCFVPIFLNYIFKIIESKTCSGWVLIVIPIWFILYGVLILIKLAIIIYRSNRKSNSSFNKENSVCTTNDSDC